MALLERFYLPTTGSVLLDGHDIGSYDRRWLRRRMAIVSPLRLDHNYEQVCADMLLTSD